MKASERWESCPLGDLLISKNDKSKQVKSTEYATVGSYPVVDQSAEFICGYHDDVTKLVDTNLPLTVFGDHTRHTKFISFPFIAGADGTQLLKPRQGIEDRFFYYLTSSAAEKIGSYGYDRHFKHLKEYLCQYPTSVPEQAKIAEILSTVDRAIEQTEALIAKQQRIKTGLMQDLLTRGIDEHGNLRSEDTHEFKDSALGRIPVEWGCSSVGSHLINIQQGWSPDCEGQSAPQGHWGVLRTTAVVWEGFQDFENKVLPGHLKPRPLLEVRAGDILMTRGGPNSRVGVVAFVRATQSKLMLSDKLYRLVPKNSLDAEYLVMALASSETQRYLSTLKTGLAESQTNISQQIVRSLLIRVSPKPEQMEVAKIVRAVNDRIDSEVRQLDKLRSLKTALMQDLLTGKVRVTL